MKVRLFAIGMFLAGLVCLAQAQFNGCQAGFCSKVVAGATSSCTQSANFQARTSGQDATHLAAYDALICGLVSQASTISGTLFSRLDALWMVRGADSTVIRLNLIQNAFNLTSNGSITFVANAGVISDGSTGYYSTGYNPTAVGGQFSQDSASIMACTSATLPVTTEFSIGSNDGTESTFLAAAGGVMVASVNTNAAFFSSLSGAAGLYHAVRDGASSQVIYVNGSSAGTSVGSSSGNINATLNLLARNGNGMPDFFTTTQYIMFAAGAAFSATDAANFRTLVAAYMAAIGSAAC